MSNTEGSELRKSTEAYSLSQVILDAIPDPVLAVDDDVRVLDCNRAARALLGPDPGAFLQRRAGDLLRCLHAADHPGGCGHGPHCASCVVRSSVGESFAGARQLRRKTRMQFLTTEGREPEEVHFLVTTSAFQWEGRRRVLLVLENVTELVRLRALMPICAWCKRVRDDQEYWQSVEMFMKAHLEVDFSHGICPECLEEVKAGLEPASTPTQEPLRSVAS
jgi:hypothetical protein